MVNKPKDEYVIITGASLGLGKAMAKEFAYKGYNLVLVSLPGEQLPLYCHELIEKYSIDAFHFETDLTELENIHQFWRWVKIKNLKLVGLVNNAGLGGSAIFDNTEINFIDSLILLNIRALALLTRLFIPELKKQKKAFILNISSIAAFTPMPYKTVYPASKAFVYSFSVGLREELKDTSIRVSVMHPGPMFTTLENTERLKKHGFMGKIIKLSVEEAAVIGVLQALAGKKVIIPGAVNKLSCKLMKMIPSYFSMPIFTRLFKKELGITSQIQKA